ncbi:hypothetical protein D3C81_1957080 [compost metagenome]
MQRGVAQVWPAVLASAASRAVRKIGSAPYWRVKALRVAASLSQISTTRCGWTAETRVGCGLWLCGLCSGLWARTGAAPASSRVETAIRRMRYLPWPEFAPDSERIMRSIFSM